MLQDMEVNPFELKLAIEEALQKGKLCTFLALKLSMLLFNDALNTFVIYSYMTSEMWLMSTQITEEALCCCPFSISSKGFFFNAIRKKG